jgi:ABC-2 type transport system ATP-binding protein
MNPVLEADHLTKRFDATTALNDVTFSFPEGHIAGLLGRNGSGKTTLLHHFVGMLLPSAGECRTLGMPGRDLGDSELSRIGFVPQTPRLIEWMTVEQHLRYLGSFYHRWDRTRLGRLQSELALPSRPRIGTLSVGDRQKFAVISAVCHHPSLLLLDEPFSALDPIVRERMLTLLIELAREDESTIVVSSHILHDVEKVIDWVICLDEGRLTVNAPLDELQERYAEWTVTTRAGNLPARFDEPCVLAQESDGHAARLLVLNPGLNEAGFRAGHDVDLVARPLNLEQLFPLLIRGSHRQP